MATENAAIFKTPSADDSVLAEIARRLVEAYRPERIYLFGSVARGEAGPDSDYDIMVIVPDDAPLKHRRPLPRRCLIRPSSTANRPPKRRSRDFSHAAALRGDRLVRLVPLGPVILVPMRVHLSPHGRQLLEAALARGVGRSPEEVVEWALEAATGGAVALSDEKRERRRQAVAGMLAFRDKHHLTLGPGLRIHDLIHQGHKY